MSAIDLAVSRLTVEEGFRAFPYRDTVGKLTIGYGCNVDAGWSPGLAKTVLAYQVEQVWQALSLYWWWASLDDVRASVLIDLAFNMGTSGLLHFVKMLSAIGAKDWQSAHDELLDSAADKLLPTRYQALAQMLLTGAV